ncbi:MAG: hypothetical protein EHM77_06465 [Planctomycetaceae bacterium]|nr:MAG: hypothetical protein EHM77_06465 [Planctomycetaceae bacterium]
MAEDATPAGTDKATKAAARSATPSKTTSVPPTKQKPTRAKKQARSTKPTEAQKRANAANAQKSTGPRTEEGKQRSSQNATTHGVFAAKRRVITRGSMAEDPAEVDGFLVSLHEAYAPQGAVEQRAVDQILMLLLQLRRLDCYEEALLEASAHTGAKRATNSYGHEEGLTLNLEWLDRLWEWTFAEDARLEGVEPSEELGVSDDPYDFRYDVLAPLMRMKSGNKDVEDQWTDEITPVTEEEWYRVFRAYYKHLFKEPREVRVWIHERRAQLIEQLDNRQVLEGSVTATSALTELDRTTQLRGRIAKQLEKAEERLSNLQARRPVAED